MKKKSKKWIWIILAVVIIAAAAFSAWEFLPRDSGESVFVYGFMDGTAGISDYYDGMNQSDGMVTTDRVQTVYLSGTQNVKEILVYDGQEVKKGDVLFTYDTTLSDIQLRRKELSVQQLKLDLVTAQQELAVINSYVPISYHPVETPDPEQPEEPKVEISDLDLEGKDYLVYTGKGDTALTPMYCWLRSETMIDELMMQALFLGRDEDSLFIVFQHTEEDSNEGAVTEEFGLKIMRLRPETEAEGEINYRFTYFDPAKLSQNDDPVDDGVDWNSGYTAAEIHQMRLAQMERIEELEFQIKMAEAEYRIMLKEADNGQVLAEFDGIVIGVLDPESAMAMGEPLLKVSGGGGYYITGTVSELDLATIELGQIVDIMSWDTGMSYEGEIIEIQPFPTENNYYYYGGSQNVSYYPYTVFVGEDAMLRDGYWVSMSLRGGEGQGGLYINNAFLLNEGAASYVYVRGEDGLLEKRRVQVGGLLWGEYSLILDGLTAEDYVAFPYGKEIREGAPTAEGTWEDLMGY